MMKRKKEETFDVLLAVMSVLVLLLMVAMWYIRVPSWFVYLLIAFVGIAIVGAYNETRK